MKIKMAGMKEELEKALNELQPLDDNARFQLKKPQQIKLPQPDTRLIDTRQTFERNKEFATREVFGDVLAKLGSENKDIYAIDGDVMNSTFTETFKKSHA